MCLDKEDCNCSSIILSKTVILALVLGTSKHSSRGFWWEHTFQEKGCDERPGLSVLRRCLNTRLSKRTASIWGAGDDILYATISDDAVLMYQSSFENITYLDFFPTVYMQYAIHWMLQQRIWSHILWSSSHHGKRMMPNQTTASTLVEQAQP